MRGIVFNPIVPGAYLTALALLMLVATTVIYWDAAKRLGPVRNAILLLLRLIGVAIILLILLQPSRQEPLPERKIQKVLLVGVDNSRSMKQDDVAKMSRLEAAKNALREARLTPGAGSQVQARLFQFSEDATPLSPGGLDLIKADGVSTRIHTSVETMIDSLSGSEVGTGLVLLTDGHDFELTNPAKTAELAKARRIPIYALPLGNRGYVRDVSVNITNFEPYSYIKQKAHISASLRLIGCEQEELTVQLLRSNEVVKTMQVNAGRESEIPVDFQVTEAEPGQYEYEVRVLPLRNELETRNNSAITFLNVIDQRIRVLLLEGSPSWDTTFLRRSLMQNDKIDLDAIVQYTGDKARRIRKADTPGEVLDQRGMSELNTPSTLADFNSYDVVILGKSVDKFLDGGRMQMLTSFVRDHGGALIFSRGKAFQGESELDPVSWTAKGSDHIHFQIGREGRLLSPFRVLSDQPGGLGALPEPIAVQLAIAPKTLAASVAEAQDTDRGSVFPGMVHRRFGRGQIFSVAVDGLWRWSFNPKAMASNNVYDRFWDQLVLWMVAGDDNAPSQDYTFRANTANLLVGSKLYLRLACRDNKHALKQAAVTIYYGDSPVERIPLAPRESDDFTHLIAVYQPEKTGRYRAVVALPDGKEQEVKWMVFDENLEEKEVAADVPYLKTLCELSGGKLLTAEELGKLANTPPSFAGELKPKFRTTSLWDRWTFFYVICGVLGLDWYLRRRWGLC